MRPAQPLLIVSADDFGLTPGVSEGILRAHNRGVVTATSALVVAPAFADHAAPLERSGLDIGLHLALVGEDPPLLSAREIPTLVERNGRLPVSWRNLAARSALGRLDPDDVRRETVAQLEAMIAVGCTPSHITTHQHVHLWPPIAGVVVDVAQQFGVRFLRIPGGAATRLRGAACMPLAGSLRRRVTAAGLSGPGAFRGLDEAGSWSTAALLASLRDLRDLSLPSVEIGSHPGKGPDPARERYRWGYAWEQELEALTSPEVANAVESLGFRLGGFADLQQAP